MNLIYEPHIWLETPPNLQKMHIYAFSIGYNGNLYILATPEKTHQQISNHPRSLFDSPVEYTLFEINEWHVETYHIPDQAYIHHYVQPLPHDEFLLVNARSGYRGRDDLDHNAQVFSTDGRKKRQFLVGDGIEDVRTTSKAEIWTSYFDEGIGGNRGWGNHPVGKQGLIKWSAIGEQKYSYQPISGLEEIRDCYALTIDAREQIWIYYYSEFPLVQIVDNQIVNYWEIPLRGAHRFAIWREYALFLGGYENQNWLTLYRLTENGAEHVKRMILAFDYDAVCSWDEALILLKDNHIYRITVSDLL